MKRRTTAYLFGVPALLAAAYLFKAADLRARRDADALVRDAAATRDWAAAGRAYAAALRLADANAFSPGERHDLRLAVEYARSRDGGIVEALRQTERIIADILTDDDHDPTRLRAARAQLAATRYYTAWLLRRDGAARREWLPLAEAARGDYRRLAEDSAGVPHDQWRDAQSDLEAVLRFVRRSDEQVRADPLPDPALATNAGRVRGVVEPPAERQPPSAGDGRGEMNNTDRRNVEKQSQRQKPVGGS